MGSRRSLVCRSSCHAALILLLAAAAHAGTLGIYESSQAPGQTLVLGAYGTGMIADVDYDASTAEGGGLQSRITEIEIRPTGGFVITGFDCHSTSTTTDESCLVKLTPGGQSVGRVILTAGDSSGQGPGGGNPSSLASLYDLGQISFDAPSDGTLQLVTCEYTDAQGSPGVRETCDTHNLVSLPEPGVLVALGSGAMLLIGLRRRRSRDAALGVLVALAASFAPPATAGVPNPTVQGPIPVTADDFPLWDSWFDLGDFGYVEEEYFISGTARQPGSPDTAPYTTRIIVARPANAADFNGSLMMDWVNVTAQFENAVTTVSSHDYLIREGWAFVHVSAQAAGHCCLPGFTLQMANPDRYGQPGTANVMNHPGDDYAFDMFAQIAQALKTPGNIDMLGGLTVERIIAAGQSQSAGHLETYLLQMQGDLGEDVIDGFLIHGRVADDSGHVALSDGSAAKQTPVLQLSSDFEANAVDPNPSDYYALWEIAGAAHADFWIGVHSEEGGGPRFAGQPKAPGSADEDLHQGVLPYTAAENYGEQVDPGQPVCILQGNQFPMHYASNAALDALHHWLRDGVKPDSGPRYEFSGGTLARDLVNQNALGGIRLAPIEHPVATYRSDSCGLGGTTVPFSDAQIIALYPTHADYACLMKDSIYQNVADGHLLAEDAVDLVARVDAAANRWGPALLGVQDCDQDTIADDVDNCPFVANGDQTDSGGGPAGDACECGDVSGDGLFDLVDRDAVERHGLGMTPNPNFLFPGNCDVDADGSCNGQDGSAIQRAALGLPAHFGPVCQNADPFAPPCPDCDPPDTGTTWFIADGPDEQEDTLVALNLASHEDTIEFGEGVFEFNTTLTMLGTAGITIRGQGRDKTFLDFLNSTQGEGIALTVMDGITIEDLTIMDTPHNAIRVTASDHVVIRNVRAMWSSKDTDPTDGVDDRGGMDPSIPSTLDVTCEYEASYPESTATYVDASGLPRNYVPDSANGPYAFYPVRSSDVLLDNVYSLGASDAGIYVGQSKETIVQNSEAIMNVAGYEIENTDDADMFGNIAHCNTAGFLIFDLPGLNRYGDRTRLFNNISIYNNTTNFAPGGIVSAVPRGVGVLQLGYDELEVFNNTIEFNSTVGLVYVSHELVDGNKNNPDNRMDLYPEGLHVHDNVFTTNGTQPAPPGDGVIVCAPGTGPDFDSPVPCVPTDINDSDPSLLPALIAVKGALAGDGFGPTGAHVVWDGILDLESNGCALDPEFADTVDANGKPQYDGQDVPACRYNDYKFTDPAIPSTRRHPQYWSCITDDGAANGNTFSPDSRKFMNFENTDPSSPPLLDIGAHDCPTQYGTQLAALAPAVVEPYVPTGPAGDPGPSAEEIAAICEAYSGSTVNRSAFPYNCELLSQYNLFADPTDPRLDPNENGILFDLTTPLFSDYALKHRFVFLPPGEAATWREGNASLPNVTLDFPVGTVIAKTFSFIDDTDEQVVETRLLFHRDNGSGESFWDGVAFIWETDGSGNRTDARIAPTGGFASVSWDYEDPDPDVTATYVGSTPNYLIPQGQQCTSCHGNIDSVKVGDAPIGPKVRLLNRPMDYGSGPVNQLQHWIDTGRLAGAPALTIDSLTHVATNAQRAPRFNVPDDDWSIPTLEPARFDPMTSTEKDVEMRTRAWLETNCAHCHNEKGLADSSGVRFDVFRKVDLSHGICKSPTTQGSGGRDFDIVPTSAIDSIVSFRVNSENPTTQMPPIARSVRHDEAAALVDAWIDSVVDGEYSGAGCELP